MEKLYIISRLQLKLRFGTKIATMDLNPYKSSTFLRGIKPRRKIMLSHSYLQQSCEIFWKVLEKLFVSRCGNRRKDCQFWTRYEMGSPKVAYIIAPWGYYSTLWSPFWFLLHYIQNNLNSKPASIAATKWKDVLRRVRRDDRGRYMFMENRGDTDSP